MSNVGDRVPFQSKCNTIFLYSFDINVSFLLKLFTTFNSLFLNGSKVIVVFYKFVNNETN